MKIEEFCASPATKKPQTDTKAGPRSFWQAGLQPRSLRFSSLEHRERNVKLHVHLGVILWVVVILCSGCNDATDKTGRAELVPVTQTAPVQPQMAVATRSADERPPKDEIDRAVNFALAKRIEWNITNKNLFAEYKVTNEYAETERGYTYFIYEFTAQCDVVDGGQSFETRNGREYYKYLQPGVYPSANGQPVPEKKVSLDGSVMLVKKGVRWYVEQPVRR
jgi:hypothetical protein